MSPPPLSFYASGMAHRLLRCEIKPFQVLVISSFLSLLVYQPFISFSLFSYFFLVFVWWEVIMVLGFIGDWFIKNDVKEELLPCRIEKRGDITLLPILTVPMWRLSSVKWFLLLWPITSVGGIDAVRVANFLLFSFFSLIFFFFLSLWFFTFFHASLCFLSLSLPKRFTSFSLPF